MTWSSRVPMTAGIALRQCLGPSKSRKHTSPSRRHQSSPQQSVATAVQCTKDIYYQPLYLQSALEEGSTIVIVELNIPNFSYSCPKLSLAGSCMSVSVVHVVVIQARNPSAICRCNAIYSSWLQLTILPHQRLSLSIFFLPHCLKYAISGQEYRKNSGNWSQIC